MAGAKRPVRGLRSILDAPGPGQRGSDHESFCGHVGQTLRSLVDTGLPKGFLQKVSDTANRKCFFLPSDGQSGLCPPGIRAGDAVVVLCGGRVPCVLRPLPTADGGVGQWQFVGECYLHREMDGRWVRSQLEAGNTGEIFTLV